MTALTKSGDGGGGVCGVLLMGVLRLHLACKAIVTRV